MIRGSRTGYLIRAVRWSGRLQCSCGTCRRAGGGAGGLGDGTLRAYAIALLRWFRFLWVIGVPWDQATRAEARDFCCWIQVAVKPAGAGGPAGGDGAAGLGRAGGARPGAGGRNPVTGKAAPGPGYAAATAVH